MKGVFREYHQPSKAEQAALWSEALIVPDTNVLLDFYCFGNGTLNDYYSVLKAAKKRGQLWMPHQVGFEFFENRIGIISRQLNQYDNITKHIDTAKDNINNLSSISPSHSHLNFDAIAKKYAEAVKPIKVEISRLKKSHPDHLNDDKVLEELENIFSDGIVGAAYTDDRREEIFKEGESRYEKRIPPGHRDQVKKEDEKPGSRNRKFGDLLIWKQIIEKAKEKKKPVIFVTNDAKDDWVLCAKDGRKLGALPALKKEMLIEAGVDFELYSSDEFLDLAHKHFNLQVDQQSVSEVKKYREIENERSQYSLHLQKKGLEGYLRQQLKSEEFSYELLRSRDLLTQSLSLATGDTHVKDALSMLSGIIDQIDRSSLYGTQDGFNIQKLLLRGIEILRGLEYHGYIRHEPTLVKLNDSLLRLLTLV